MDLFDEVEELDFEEGEDEGAFALINNIEDEDAFLKLNDDEYEDNRYDIRSNEVKQEKKVEAASVSSGQVSEIKRIDNKLSQANDDATEVAREAGNDQQAQQQQGANTKTEAKPDTVKPENGRTDYRARGYRIKKKEHEQQKFPSSSLTTMTPAKKAKPSNPFMEEDGTEPDPTDYSTLPREIIEVSDDEVNGNDDDIQILENPSPVAPMPISPIRTPEPEPVVTNGFTLGSPKVSRSPPKKVWPTSSPRKVPPSPPSPPKLRPSPSPQKVWPTPSPQMVRPSPSPKKIWPPSPSPKKIWPSSPPQNQNNGLVCRNPEANGRRPDPFAYLDSKEMMKPIDPFFIPITSSIDTHMDDIDEHETEDTSKMSVRRDRNHRDSGWNNPNGVLRRTQPNDIKNRKASHKPCNLKQKLLEFNHRSATAANASAVTANGQENGTMKGNRFRLGNLYENIQNMTNGTYTANTIPPTLKKYWHQRYDLFSKFDQGIRLDEESWYSVTPESIALHIARRCHTQGTIIDAFCGCGGNTIQFAKYCKKVVAIDIDPKKIEMAMHNAKIYGVEHKIDFIVADFMAIAPVLKADIVFLSPPWGGPDYQNALVFDIEKMIPMDGIKLFHLAKRISENVVYFLPKNVNVDQLLDLAFTTQLGIDVEENFLNGRVKTITAYFGKMCVDRSNDAIAMKEDTTTTTSIQTIHAPPSSNNSNGFRNSSGSGKGGYGLGSGRVPGGPAYLRIRDGSPELVTTVIY